VYATNPGDEYWSSDYYHAGVSGYLNTMMSQPGAVYVGGNFSSITDIPALNISRMEMVNGIVTQVNPLGSGLDDQVKALCDHNGDLIAGGYFDSSGEVTLNRVGRWDGAAWFPLGDGLPDVLVNSLASYQGQIYAGSHGGVHVWDGTQWTLAFVTDGLVGKLLVHDGLLFAGGGFSQVQGQAHQNVFGWDGSEIVTLDEGFSFPVNGITSTATGIVFSGNSDIGYGKVSRWDGVNWIPELENVIVNDVVSYNGDLVVSVWLYVGGSMFEPCMRSNNGGYWHTIGDFDTGILQEHEGFLLAKVSSGVESGILSPGLIGYNGSSLYGVLPSSNGFTSGFDSLAPMATSLFVGGSYTIADGREFDGSGFMANGSWYRWGDGSDLATSFPGSFVDLAVVGGDIYGVYQYVDYDVGVEILARLVWEGSYWHWEMIDPGTWFNGSLQTIGMNLYNIGYGVVNQIDLQYGTLIPVPGLDLDGNVYDSCEYQGALTIGGDFTSNNGLPVSNVLQYANNSWEEVGGSLPGLRILAEGSLDEFSVAAATRVDGVWSVSIFDGTSWSILPGNFDGSITRLVVHRGRLFAAGNFNNVGSVFCPGISVWTGDQWVSVGSGVPGRTWGRVEDMVSAGDNLFLVGSFTMAGGHLSTGFAQWSGDPTEFTGEVSAVPDGEPSLPRLLGGAFPNPFNPRTEVFFIVPEMGSIEIGIFDLRGNQIRRLVHGSFDAGSYSRAWNGLDDSGRSLPSGIYFARMLTGNRMEAIKLTLVR
jgi:hypothetical protein